jgi:membrane protein DedA with SNARE-associated domain
MPGLLLISLATLVSEDLTCIAAGVLVAQGKLDFWTATLAGLLGIFAGDLALFAVGRLAGRAALAWTPLRRIVSPAQVDRASAWLSARGPEVVLFSRFTPGLRLPTYFAAGVLKTSTARFMLCFLAAAALWTPILVGSAVLFGARFGESIPALIGTAMSIYFAVRYALRFRTRRRIVGFVRRKLCWEFWPVWAAYLPVVLYILYLGCKHRCLTLFTAANPGIPSGGLMGESKSAILARLSDVPDFVPAYTIIRNAAHALDFMRENGLSYPVVLKPDVGERGSGVAIVRSDAELTERLAAASSPTILQEYVGGLEFGVFYLRYPGDARGRVLYITEKLFPAVTGDGRSTVRDLILADDRAVCLAGAYFRATRRSLDEVPAAREQVQLVEIGSHCRGSIFLNGTRYRTSALEDAVDRLSRAHPGFFIGRYDVRAASLADLQAGRFQVIELNGVAGEATHIYDPAVSLLEAYRVLFRHWRMAFDIGALNRACGASPMPLGALLRLILRRPALEVAHARSVEVLD